MARNNPPRNLNNASFPDIVEGGFCWGDYSSAATLPNVAADALNVHIGDVASVSGRLYECRLGTSGSAIWDPVSPVTVEARLFNHKPNVVAANLASTGTDAAVDAATSLYYTELLVPHKRTVTNINFLQGTTVGTDKMRGLIFDSAGAFVVGTATAGVTTSGADTFLQVPLTAATVLAPGRYYVGLKMNGTTDGFQSLSAGQQAAPCEKETGHTFAGNDDITSVATTFTAGAAPIFFLD